MKRTLLALTTIILTLAFTWGCAPRKGEKEAKKVSRPFEYKGYSRPEYKSYTKFSEYITLSDGTRIAADIYLPDKGPEKKSFPVAFQFLPYTRGFGFPNMAWYERLYTKMKIGSAGPVFDMTVLNKKVPFLLSYGYAFVIADMRGTGASFGRAFHPLPENRTDVEEVLKWIADQSWCDGNIGMFGGSYKGYIQLLAASRQVEELKCIAPQVAPLGYADLAYPGGIYSQGFLKQWSEIIVHLNENHFIPREVYPLPMVLPAMPVVDEDGDGKLVDEIPVHGKYDDETTFLDGPPVYRDGNEREGVYYKATKGHKINVAFDEWAGELKFMDAHFPEPYSDLSLYDMVVHSFMPKIMETEIPIYNIGGWHDGNVRGATEAFCTMRGTNPSKLLIHAGYHNGHGPFWEYFGKDEKEVLDKFKVELLRFYDRYLKGIHNGIDKEPPVYIYVQNGDGWRAEREWPLERRKITDFYLAPNNKLARKSSGTGADNYKVDFSHDSRYGTHNGNRYLSAASVNPDVLPVRTEKDKKCLTYTTAPLKQDTEVTGHPIVKLWVSSTADYGDFFVYLEDVDENGRAILVTEGQLRAGFAAMHDNDEMGVAGLDIEPELPWHGYESEDYADAILADGNVVKLEFDLHPTSWVFRKGRRIRVSVAGADWPTFRLHPELSPENKPDAPGNTMPTIAVHRGAQHPSHIRLPVIPEKGGIPENKVTVR